MKFKTKNILYAVILFFICFSAGCNSNNISDTLVGYVNPGDPQLGTPEGYAGSQVCKECHFAKYERWRGTLHNMSLRGPDQRGLAGKGIVADSDENGVVDFKEGLDLGTYEKSSDFHEYGAYAPLLGYDSATEKYTVKIGSVTYSIDRLYGGNGSFAQIFLTKIDRCYYILPVQYNEKTRTYSLFKGFNWYDKNKLPIYDSAEKTPVSAGRAYDSFERMCSGCHNSGIFIEYDDSTGEYLTGYIELNVGCENCHNGGASHRKQGGGRGVGGIFNPKNVLDGTVDGLKRANEVCGRCHTRGQSVAETSGNPLYNRLDFPATKDGSGRIVYFPQGETLGDYLITTTNPANYWGYDSSDASFIASRSNYQQLLDMNIGAHSPDSGTDPAKLPSCFTCHDAHGTENGSSIVDSLTIDNVAVNVSTSDNTLCLSCHAESVPFADITKTDLINITEAYYYENVRKYVSKHTKHPYSPEEYETGRCTNCHMVKTAKSSDEYSITSHTFNVISPYKSKDMDSHGSTPIPNSCNGCHNDTSDFAVDKFDSFTEYTAETAIIPESHEQDASWRETYHMLYTSLNGDDKCQACHLRNNEEILPKANPGCTSYCHGI